jgi:copper(I)-binding protein
MHEMTMTDGVMRMRALPDGIAIKPGETVDLTPGGSHLMFQGLKNPLKEGDRFSATLRFKNGLAVEVEFAVARLGATTPPQAHR